MTCPECGFPRLAPRSDRCWRLELSKECRRKQVGYRTLTPEVRKLAEGILTRKQLDVLKLWLNGYGTTRISLILDIAEPTARGHLRRALQKLKPYMEEEAA